MNGMIVLGADALEALERCNDASAECSALFGDGSEPAYEGPEAFLADISAAVAWTDQVAIAQARYLAALVELHRELCKQAGIKGAQA
ncbi:hypothetical protein D3C76_1741430 [compost metagenome]